MPTSSTLYAAPVDMSLIVSPGDDRAVEEPAASLWCPGNESYRASNMRADRGFPTLPEGGGMRVTIASRMSSIPDPFLGRAEHGLIGVEPEFVVYLVLHPFDVGGRQVDLVDHRDDDKVVLHGRVQVGERLGLHALGGVDEEENPFARGEGARYLVGEVDVAGRVDEVELEVDAVLRSYRAGRSSGS